MGLFAFTTGFYESQTRCVVEDDLEFLIFLLPPFTCWNSMHIPQPGVCGIGNEPRASSMLGKQSMK